MMNRKMVIEKKTCCSVVYFCRTADVIVISQNSFLLAQTAARLLKDKLSPIDWTKLGTYMWLISALIITIPTFSNLISYQLSWFVQVVAWFVVIFGINTTNDILKLLYVISRAVRRVKFETILKYHEWYLCQISRTNHAIICLYYYPQKVCNFHM